MNRLQRRSFSIALALVLCTASGVSAQQDFSKLRGTWQVVSVRNLNTGAVDTISRRRIVLTRYTDRYWTYTYMDRDRPGSDAYSNVWDADGLMRYWSAGGNYWLTGADRNYTNLVSIEPYQVQLGNTETVVQVDDNTYIYRSRPDAQGVQRETVQRRIDHLTRTNDGSRQDLLKGLWQLMQVRDVSTGAVDEIAQKRTIWLHVSDSMYTYIDVQKDRPVTTPAELSNLTPTERVQRNRDKIWSSGRPRFDSNAGSYRLTGNTLTMTPWIALDRGAVSLDNVVSIHQLDAATLVFRVNRGDTILELIHRRLD